MNSKPLTVIVITQLLKIKTCLCKNCLKSLFVFVILLSLVTTKVYSTLSHDNVSYILYPRETNYFKEAKYYENLSYVLETSTCRIPDFAEALKNDNLTEKMIKPTVLRNCAKSSRRWSYVDGTTLIVDEGAIKSSGFSILLVECCYQEIRRVEQSPKSYNNSADRLSNLSKNCKHLHNGVNNIAEEFIKVQCFSLPKTHEKSEKILIYTNYHAIVNASKTSLVKSKVQTWKASNIKQLPPNVLILGIDSLSRANFQRSMPKTAKVLHVLGAIEMMGFMKVADNTFLNLVPALSGVTVDDLPNFCANYNHEAQDKCPYIWKDFNSSGYLTAHLEDAPMISIFNYMKLGFVQQQVDYYIRPFMMNAYGGKMYRDCIGPDNVHNKVLNYFRRLIHMASDQQVPLFSLTWLTNLAHDDMNALASADEHFETFFRSLDLKRTILFFMSDHGSRFGPFRSTHYGWYEGKLPNFWLYLPPYLRKQKPEWIHNLQLNSKRISSQVDIYPTLRHILKDIVKSETNFNSAFYFAGQSLFERIPVSRTCKDAHVDDAYCPCLPPNQIPVDSDEAKLAANAAIVEINKKLTSRCAQLSLQKVIAAAATSSALNGNSTTHHDSIVYIVTFALHPGSVLVESTVRYFSHSESFLPSKHMSIVGRVGNEGRNCVDDSGLALVCQCL